MKKSIYILALLLVSFLLLVACTKSNNSTFSITFIDVEQGDAALVECDKHYMLIDGGSESKGKNVLNILKEKEIQKLDILAISHLHEDHYGGLISALGYATSIKKTICNTDVSKTSRFTEFEHQLSINGSKISIPHAGDKFKLGSATVEVVDVSAVDENDSLVLLITYGKTKFLFTGDIGEKQQKNIAEKYANSSDTAYHIDLMKMPHHGADSHTLYQFLRTFMPEYAIISVGKNQYGHPDKNTISKLEQANAKIYRTDVDGNIIVKSNGKDLSIKSSK